MSLFGPFEALLPEIRTWVESSEPSTTLIRSWRIQTPKIDIFSVLSSSKIDAWTLASETDLQVGIDLLKEWHIESLDHAEATWQHINHHLSEEYLSVFVCTQFPEGALNKTTQRIVMPRLMYMEMPENAVWQWNVTQASDDISQIQALLKKIEKAIDKEKTESAPLRLETITYSVSEAEWADQVARIHAEIKKGMLQKCVLARQTKIVCSRPMDIFLDVKTADLKGTYYIAIKEADCSFFAVTPELLYTRKQNQVKSMAIAGTRKRGLSEGEDHHLGEALWDSEKESREHALVTEYVVEALKSCCDGDTKIEGKKILKLNKVQHLLVMMEGQLRSDASDLDLIKALHPTPATAGSPREASLALIDVLESQKRGCYAGAMGWVSKEKATLAVTIRGGYVQGEILTLVSGAGIVAQSEASAEWKELNLKVNAILNHLEFMP